MDFLTGSKIASLLAWVSVYCKLLEYFKWRILDQLV